MLPFIPPDERRWPYDTFTAIEAESGDKKGPTLARIISKDSPGETLYLECKGATSDNGKPEPGDKEQYAKTVSAFANADGGLLVWGVYWPDDMTNREARPPTFPGVPNAETFCKWLNIWRKEVVDPPPPWVESIVVPAPDGSDTHLVVTYVAKSHLAPHMAKMGEAKRSETKFRYFRRGSDGSRMMHAYEVEDAMGRRSGPALYPRVIFNCPRDSAIQMTWHAWNNGRGIAIAPCLEVRLKVYVNDKQRPLGSTSILLDRKNRDILPHVKDEEPLMSGNTHYVYDCFIPMTGPPIRSADGHRKMCVLNVPFDRLAQFWQTVDHPAQTSSARISFEWTLSAQDMRPQIGSIDLDLLHGEGCQGMKDEFDEVVEHHYVVRGIPSVRVCINPVDGKTVRTEDMRRY